MTSADARAGLDLAPYVAPFGLWIAALALQAYVLGRFGFYPARVAVVGALLVFWRRRYDELESVPLGVFTPFSFATTAQLFGSNTSSGWRGFSAASSTTPCSTGRATFRHVYLRMG